jgi:hypothetical protein
MRHLLLLGLLLVDFVSGCTSVERLAEVLDQRQVNSCLIVRGLYPPFVSVSGVIATGGVRMEACRGERDLEIMAPVRVIPRHSGASTEGSEGECHE